MKKILIFIIIFLSLSLVVYAEDINECKTDIYFGNGVWNEPEDAEENRLQLEIRIINKEIIKNRVDLSAKYGEVKLQYNWGQSWDIDLVETFYQLKEAGQLSEWAFFALMDELLTKRAADITGEDLEIMRNKLLAAIIYNEQSNVDDMLTKYYNESFKWGHRVLLVSHSQGNLFANRVYDSINPSGYKNYFANVQVASPASSVHADKGTYVTGYVDPIINSIPGSMPNNAVLNLPGGHAFVEAYLDSLDSYDRIVKGIKSELSSLDSEMSQWQTDQEIDKGTCDYRITVKHRFDPALEIGEKVYPFNTSKKLYQVNGAYVKATCGGTDFTDDWADKKESECWMINNEPKEKISKANSTIKFYALYQYTDPDTVKIHLYGYRADVTYFTNNEYKFYTSCDGYGNDLVMSFNSYKNSTPEELREILAVHSVPNRAFQCNLDKASRSKEDISYIKMTSIETELKHDTRPYILYRDYYETKVEYTVYFK